MDDGRRHFAEAFERIVRDIPSQPEFAGIEIVQSSVQRHRSSATLSVTVDRDGGVDIGSCQRIASRINAALDGFPDLYTLEVTSAGLDRPLVQPHDYERFAGRAAKIVTTLPIEGAKTHRGTLVGLRGHAAVIERDGKELPIPLEVVRSANLEYDIRADLKRAKAQRNDERR